MAVTKAGARLTEAHRLAQVAIGARTVTLLRAAWSTLNVDNIDGTRGMWLAVSRDSLEAQHQRSVRTAIAYGSAFRRVEVGSPLPVAAAAITLPAKATTSLEVLGPIGIKVAIGSGIAPAAAKDSAFNMLARTSMLHVLNGGRQSLERDVRRDPRCIGYQRVTDGDPCYFCAMLAGRGPVYSKRSFDAADPHLGCGCTLEPVYSRESNWVGNAAKFGELLSENDDPKAFRAAYAERD
jgi:hypothetical protein